MYLYYIVLFVVTGWVYLIGKTLNRKALWTTLAILAILPTIRNFTIGTDTPVYTASFRINLNPDSFVFNPFVEKGFQLLQYISLNISSEYSVFFFLSAVLVLFFNLKAIKELSENYTLSIFCFICFGFYTFFFSGVRQGIAMAICMYAHTYIVRDKKLAASLLIILATFFHVSAFIMFLALISRFVKLRVEIKALACFVASVVGSRVLIQYMAESNDRYQSYTDTVTNAGGYLTLVLFGAVGFIFYIFGSKFRKTNSVYKYLEEFYICGLALLIPIALLGTDPSGPQRVLFYFSWSLVILIPLLLKRFNNIFIKATFAIVSLAYFYVITVRFYDLYPFVINPKFVFM
ncbi:EpsG family protein [Erwinia sp. SLM-02]|uniref:EpsG family protein n=1 Tax=Erwinia sp. SLM-02 TaxID=3020057 RepID=UPI00307FE26F